MAYEPFKLNKKWAFRFSYKGERYRQQGIATKAEANMIIQNILSSHATNIKHKIDYTFEEYYTLWVEAYKAKHVSHGVYNRYFNAMKKFLAFFGKDTRPGDITQREYQEYMNFLGENFTLGTMRKDHQPIQACYEQAVYDGVTEKNPTFNARLVSEIPNMPEHVKFMEDYEYDKIKKVFVDMNSRSSLLLYILHATGARFSEINNLFITNINFKNETIRIDDGKTANAARTIELSPIDTKYIKMRLNELRLDVSRPLFNYSHSFVTRKFKVALKQSEISTDKILHSLRHTHITYLVDKGVDIEHVSKRVGHANVNITREFYGHRFKKQIEKDKIKVKEALNVMEETHTP